MPESLDARLRERRERLEAESRLIRSIYAPGAVQDRHIAEAVARCEGDCAAIRMGHAFHVGNPDIVFSTFVQSLTPEPSPPADVIVPPAPVGTPGDDDTLPDDDTLTCDGCGGDIERGNEYTVADGVFCESCFDEAFTTCADCDRTIPRDDAYSADGETVCYSCHRNRYFSCARCGDSYPNDSAVRRRGRRYCESCAENMGLLDDDSNEFGIIRGRRFDAWPFRRAAGVEYEYLAPRGMDDPARLNRYGEFHDDGSVCGRDSEWGREFAARPATGDAFVRSVRNVCGALRGCRVNKSCGLHVHVDMNDTTPRQRANVCEWWRMLEPLILATVAPSRRLPNSYCAPWRGRDCSDSGERYLSLNTSAYHKHGTFEFRLHQGSLNPGRILAWSRLCLSFVESYKDVPLTTDIEMRYRAMSDRGRVTLFFQTCPMPLSLKKHVVRRMREFAELDAVSGRTPVVNLSRECA